MRATLVAALVAVALSLVGLPDEREPECASEAECCALHPDDLLCLRTEDAIRGWHEVAI